MPIFTATEFWSAIAGAVVGGIIAYIVQWQALREGRRQRAAESKQAQQALGHSLLFKMIRVLSGIHGVYDHIEGCFEQAKQQGLGGEPWSFVLPLANFPDPIHFSADEMGMLLAQKDDETFNAILSMDVIHNSLVDAARIMSVERRALAERLRPAEAKGSTLAGVLSKEEMLVLRPHMIDVNSLVENLRAISKANFIEADQALKKLDNVLRNNLGLRHKLKLIVDLPKGDEVPSDGK